MGLGLKLWHTSWKFKLGKLKFSFSPWFVTPILQLIPLEICLLLRTLSVSMGKQVWQIPTLHGLHFVTSSIILCSEMITMNISQFFSTITHQHVIWQAHEIIISKIVHSDINCKTLLLTCFFYKPFTILTKGLTFSSRVTQ